MTDELGPDRGDGRSDRLDDLARLLVGLPWWRWMPGMRMLDGACVLAVGGVDFRGDFIALCDADHDACALKWYPRLAEAADIPDLTDPATIGCLRALVSEHVGSPVSIRWVPHLIGGVWYAETPGALQARGPTEAHALIALALQVTP